MFGVITIVTSKGGAGKTTLSRSLASHWAALGHKPAMVDGDPEARLAKRHDPAGKLGSVPLIAEPEERIADVIEELRARHAPVIVDTRASETAPTSARWSLPIWRSSRSSPLPTTLTRRWTRIT